jgi:hypothetical protein
MWVDINRPCAKVITEKKSDVYGSIVPRRMFAGRETGSLDYDRGKLNHIRYHGIVSYIVSDSR